jgi:hypothetical protein
MRVLRKGITGLAATAACLAAFGTGSALASSISLSSGTLTYTGTATEANHVTFSFDLFHGYVIQDTGVAGISVPNNPNNQPGCRTYAAQTVYCDWGTVYSIVARLGDRGSFAQSKLSQTPVTLYAGAGNDTLIGGGGANTLVAGAGTDTLTAGSGNTRLVGGSGATTLTGGSGHNVYQGGSGADTIKARNGVTEDVTCGAGADAVTADTTDTASADCEVVDRGAVQPTTGGDPTSGTAPGGTLPVAEPPLPAISTAPVTLRTDNQVPIQVTCPATATMGCSGSIALDLATATTPKGKVVAARRVKRRISVPKRFRLKAGQKAVVRVALSRRGARKFKRASHGRKSLKVQVTLTMRSPAGAQTATRTITVHAARRSRGSMKARGRR